MHYYKYDGPRVDTQALKAQVERRCRSAKWWGRGGNIVFWTVSLLLLALSFVLISWLLPSPEELVLLILTYIARWMLAVFLGLICIVMGTLAATPLWGKREKTHGKLLKQAQYEACAALRDYYRFRFPVLVTKCYDSSDRRFTRHDVCLYFVEDTLRITANLHYGFFRPERDLGCYVLDRQELQLTRGTYKDRPCTMLQAGSLVFCLGQRADAFLRSAERSELD